MAHTSHPRGLYLLAFAEMAERFSYFGMRAIFVLYLVSAFFTSDMASQIYGSYAGLIYLTPLIGGYVADRYWGNCRSIIIGGIVMAIGHLLLFVSASSVEQSIFQENGLIDPTVNNTFSTVLIFAGLTTLIIGSGFIKPNVSTMVNDLYEESDSQKESAFTIFYTGINIGAFLSPIICGIVGYGTWASPSNFRWAFLCSGVVIALATAVFASLSSEWLITPDGLGIGLPPEESELRHRKDRIAEEEAKAEEAEEQGKHKVSSSAMLTEDVPFREICCGILVVLLFLLFSIEADNTNDFISAVVYSLSIVLPLYIITDKKLTSHEKKDIGVIYIIALFVVTFWTAIEQAGTSLTLFADRQCDRTLGSWTIPTTWFQSIGPITIIIFGPILAGVWDFLASHKLSIAAPYKQAIGLAMISLGYLLMAFLTNDMLPITKLSMFWLIAMYFLHTIGELAVSPTGLEVVTRLSPARLSSLLMAIWFMSNAAASIIAGNLATLLPLSGKQPGSILGYQILTFTDFFLLFAVITAASSILLVCLTPVLKKMSNVKL